MFVKYVCVFLIISVFLQLYRYIKSPKVRKLPAEHRVPGCSESVPPSKSFERAQDECHLCQNAACTSHININSWRRHHSTAQPRWKNARRIYIPAPNLWSCFIARKSRKVAWEMTDARFTRRKVGRRRDLGDFPQPNFCAAKKLGFPPLVTRGQLSSLAVFDIWCVCAMCKKLEMTSAGLLIN